MGCLLHLKKIRKCCKNISLEKNWPKKWSQRHPATSTWVRDILRFHAVRLVDQCNDNIWTIFKSDILQLLPTGRLTRVSGHSNLHKKSSITLDWEAYREVRHKYLSEQMPLQAWSMTAMSLEGAADSLPAHPPKLTNPAMSHVPEMRWYDRWIFHFHEILQHQAIQNYCISWDGCRVELVRECSSSGLMDESNSWQWWSETWVCKC